MMILPCAFWPLAEHAEFGQNCFDASIGSVSVCIYDSMPIDACLFKPSFPFHRIVGSYPKSLMLNLPFSPSILYRIHYLQLFLLPGNSVLVDAYILQLAVYTELNCHNIYPPCPVHIAMEIEIVGSYLQ